MRRRIQEEEAAKEADVVVEAYDPTESARRITSRHLCSEMERLASAYDSLIDGDGGGEEERDDGGNNDNDNDGPRHLCYRICTILFLLKESERE